MEQDVIVEGHLRHGLLFGEGRQEGGGEERRREGRTQECTKKACESLAGHLNLVDYDHLDLDLADHGAKWEKGKHNCTML